MQFTKLTTLLLSAASLGLAAPAAEATALAVLESRQAAGACPCQPGFCCSQYGYCGHGPAYCGSASVAPVSVAPHSVAPHSVAPHSRPPPPASIVFHNAPPAASHP